MADPSLLTHFIKTEASRLGFFLCGVTEPSPPPHFDSFKKWVAQGRYAGMDYLARPDTLEKRANPLMIMPECRSVICLGIPYPTPEQDVPISAASSPMGKVASYAWGADYHTVFKERIQQLQAAVQKFMDASFAWLAYSDTGPVLERDLAVRAGLGWIGKNSCLIHPGAGSYFLLAEVFTDLVLQRDAAFHRKQCGTCRRCIEACPTHAIQEDRTIDARRCISYLTIENKGPIPPELRRAMGEWVFGCDACQIACPWNRKPTIHSPDPGLTALPQIKTLDLHQILCLDEDQFKQTFHDRPILRAKWRGLLRNACVTLGNRGDPSSGPGLGRVLSGCPDPLLRGHAAWALGQIVTELALSELSAALGKEKDESVLSEIRSAFQTKDYPAG